MKVNKNDVLNDLKALLSNKYSDNLKDLVLFGSQITSKARSDSDYDFLVILMQKADWKTEREISDLCFEIELKYSIVIDTHILAESELNTLRGKQPIFVNAMQKGLHAS
jgi:predicted nucleotidyltransferase